MEIKQYLPAQFQPAAKVIEARLDTVRESVQRVRPERVVSTAPGPTIIADPGDYIEWALARNEFEEQVIEYFIDLVENRSGHFVDIGSNIGYYAFLFAHHAAEDSRIDAFEPLPYNLARFSRNLSFNRVTSDLRIHPCGLSTTTGMATLSVSDAHPGESTLRESLASSTADRTIDVRMTTLDEVFADGCAGTPTVLKLDVEGAEFDVLAGGEALLERSQPDLIIELHSQSLDPESDEFATGIELLLGAGYDTARDVESGREYPLSTLEVDMVEHGMHLHIT